MKRLCLLLLAPLLFGCTQQAARVSAGPEDQVELFVRLSAEVQDPADRKKLAHLCTGRMRRTLEALSDDAFRVSYVNQPLKIKRFQVLSVEKQDALARVHYQVEVENPGGQQPSLESNEREVELLWVDGQWQLEAIRPKGSDQIAFTRGMIF